MTPARLAKKEEKTFDDKVEDVLMQYAHIIIPICILIGIILVIILVITIAQDASAVPTTVESGNYYYHLKDVV